MVNELGAYYKGTGRFEEAERCFLQALDLLADEGDGHATALNNLAGTHRLMGRLDDAEIEFRRCLGLYRDSVGERHVLYAAALNNLSLVCMERDQLEDAARYQAQAADILAGLPQYRDELAVSLINLGTLYQRLGRDSEAEKKLTEAINMFREELGARTPHYHAALNGLGVVHYRQGRYADAEAEFLAAAEAAEVLYGADHYEAQAARKHAQMARQQLEDQS
jgi:tetratricopeptide (TPR) repeat protein